MRKRLHLPFFRGKERQVEKGQKIYEKRHCSVASSSGSSCCYLKGEDKWLN